MQTTTLTRLMVIGVWLVMGATGASAGTPTAHHDLNVDLFPEEARLSGRDRIRLQGASTAGVELVLSPRARIHEISLDGRRPADTIDQGRLILAIDPAQDASTAVDIAIRYTCRFDDPAPVRPVNTDNPGFGVSGTISPQGTFILSGAGW